jgi:16S rRNA (adenine1518-N6/adenine1519-N6)-dimethyltransferase
MISWDFMPALYRLYAARIFLPALQTKQQIQALLAECGTRPKHRFGQNFMIDGNLLRLLAKAGGLSADDLAIEIGPGTGSLTEEILSAGCRAVAVEIDRDLAQLLRTRLGANPRFHLIEGDALAGKHALCAELLTEIHNAKSVKLVANLPYNIASPLVIEMLIAGVGLLAFTVQKEVAQRLKAAAGSEHYGPLSVMAQLLSEVELLRTIPPQAFWPMPRIESALVRMTRRDRLGAKAADFSRFMHGVFSFRRKMLRKAILSAGSTEAQADAALAAGGLSPRIRPEELSPDQWLGLYDNINPAPSSSTASAV